MKERLVELLSKHQKICNENCTGLEKSCYRCSLEQLADYILADGWMRPPCKVGQKLYTVYTRGINDKFIQESTVSKIVFDDWDGLRIIKKVVDERGCCFFYDVDQEQLNKTTFFSKEEAERHL